jgi:GMP synthase (glutamine-hydrolysing)
LLEWPEHVYHWHCEGFDLPHGTERLATGPTFENQAIRYGGAAYGVQFHPETTLAMICRWTTMASHRFGQPGARPRAEHIQGYDLHGPRLRKWLDEFMRMWIAPCAAARKLPVARRTETRAADHAGRRAFQQHTASPG